MKIKSKTKQMFSRVKITMILASFIVGKIIYPSQVLSSENTNPKGDIEGYYNYIQGKIQYGYNVATFTRNNILLKQHIEKLRELEKTIDNADGTISESFQTIRSLNQEEKQNQYEHNQIIMTEEKQAKHNASARGEFKYIPHSDGSIEYFKNGLVTRILNQRVVDDFGNVSCMNLYNMKYNDKRLLISYEADRKDNLGNVTHIKWQGAKYSPDSVFYATKDTNANKNLIAYHIQETDPAGNTKETNYKALEYSEKLITKYTMSIKDSVYGNTEFTRSSITYINNDSEKIGSYHEEGVGPNGRPYSLDRYGMSYNDKNQITGYKEFKTIYDYDGSLISTVTTDARLIYKDTPRQFGKDVRNSDPDRLEKSVIITTQENADGSRRTETSTTYYTYNSSLKLTGARGKSEFSGQKAKWWEYTDSKGHILSKNEDKKGNVTYTYIDSNTHKVITVPENQVTASLKNGNKYSGTSEIQYEILSGKPMTSQVHSIVSYYHPESFDLLRTEKTTLIYTNGLVNNLLRTLGTIEHTEAVYTQIDAEGNPMRENRDITTNYIYEANGNLAGASGRGKGSGYKLTNEGWSSYTSKIEIDYGLFLGKIKKIREEEIKDYKFKGDS